MASATIPNHVDWLLSLFETVVPAAALEMIRDSIERVVTRPHRALFTASIVVSIWAGANAVEAIIQGLHRVQGLYEDRPFWKMRVLTLLLAVGVSFFAVLGLLVLWFGSLVSRWWEVRGGLGPLSTSQVVGVAMIVVGACGLWLRRGTPVEPPLEKRRRHDAAPAAVAGAKGISGRKPALRRR